MTEVFSLTDTHCHLDFSSFALDRDEVVERARTAGLDRILNPGIDIGTSEAALILADTFPEVYIAVGIHPNSALSWNSESYQVLENLARHPKVVAVGEIGLDYYRKDAPVDVQKYVFQAQLELASDLDLPVIIHNRDAYDDMYEIIDNWIKVLRNRKSELVNKPGVFHSFSGNLNQALWAVERKFYIGITGPVTFQNSSRLQQVAGEVPPDNLLVETDAPYQTPYPHRGERNEPAHIPLITGKIAELRTIDKDEVAKATSNNAARLFCWREIY